MIQMLAKRIWWFQLRARRKQLRRVVKMLRWMDHLRLQRERPNCFYLLLWLVVRNTISSTLHGVLRDWQNVQF